MAEIKDADEQKAPENTSDGARFAESLGEDSNAGKDFAKSLESDVGWQEYEGGDANKIPDRVKDEKTVMESKFPDIHPIPSELSRQDTPPLTDDEKAKIKEETGWPDDIVDAIASMEEYELYKEAGLVYAEIDGKPCLINPNIDMDQKDEHGRTNKELMENGLAPLDKDGKPIELHHIGQKPDSPLAELTQEQHRGKGNDEVLHDKSGDSQIDRGEFQKERSAHWESRAEQG